MAVMARLPGTLSPPAPAPPVPAAGSCAVLKTCGRPTSVSTPRAPGGRGVMTRRADSGTAPPEEGVYVPDEPTPSSYRSRQKLPRHRRRTLRVARRRRYPGQ